MSTPTKPAFDLCPASTPDLSSSTPAYRLNVSAAVLTNSACITKVKTNEACPNMSKATEKYFINNLILSKAISYYEPPVVVCPNYYGDAVMEKCQTVCNPVPQHGKGAFDRPQGA
ncbi:hypothetical protein SCLCIDRAFT_1223551, partial [Scleroderma citrinum Foug A]